MHCAAIHEEKMIVLEILMLASPVALASFGSLASEYSGRMAMFIDGIINLAAFLCWAFSVQTHSIALGILLSVIFCTACIGFAIVAIEKTNANPFLAALGINLFSSALISLLSFFWFGTRGVLSKSEFFLPQAETKIFTAIFAGIAIALLILFLFKTKNGLYLRITGSDKAVLESRGVSVFTYRVIGWLIASLYGSLAGCVLALRLSSFVPNISSGRGWLALAAVFIGRKTCKGTFIAAIAFGAAEYLASRAQNFFPEIAPPLLLSLPYIVSLILILFQTKKS